MAKCPHNENKILCMYVKSKCSLFSMWSSNSQCQSNRRRSRFKITKIHKIQYRFNKDQIKVFAARTHGRLCNEWCALWKIMSKPSYTRGTIANACNHNTVRCMHQTRWWWKYFCSPYNIVRVVWLFSVNVPVGRLGRAYGSHLMCFCFDSSALFTSPLNDCVQSEVSIPGIRSPIMQTIINYAYSRVADINEENVTEVMKWAHYFGYERLVAICSAFVLNRLNADNCISYMLDARWVQIEWKHTQNRLHCRSFSADRAYTSNHLSNKRECMYCGISWKLL